MKDSQELTQEQVQRLTGLAEEAEQELALGVESQSSRAFNLGCTLWFIPGAVVVIAAFLLTKGNWVITAFLAVLVGVFAVGFAIVSAYNTKKKATERLYQEMTLPKIDAALAASNLSLVEFNRIALRTLPSDALLHQLLDNQNPDDGPAPEPSDRIQKP